MTLRYGMYHGLRFSQASSRELMFTRASPTAIAFPTAWDGLLPITATEIQHGGAFAPGSAASLPASEDHLTIIV
jgi:hypothetical protein